MVPRQRDCGKSAARFGVADCVKENILREFLEKHGGEVVSILNREWNWDEALEVRAEEAKEDRSEEIAQNLFDVLDVETIAEKTKLSLGRIIKLKEQYIKNKSGEKK